MQDESVVLVDGARAPFVRLARHQTIAFDPVD
jgi:hypothetical protein